MLFYSKFYEFYSGYRIEASSGLNQSFFKPRSTIFTDQTSSILKGQRWHQIFDVDKINQILVKQTRKGFRTLSANKRLKEHRESFSK